MRILLIEDDKRLAELLATRLRGEGHEAETCHNGIDGLERASSGAVDLAIVDVMLPGMDGVSLTTELRDRGVHVPVLMLTARDTVEDRVTGLRSGADDYLVKPFAFAELIARINALGRRSSVAAARPLQAGDLSLDELRHVAQVGDKTVDLSAREFALLGYFIRHVGQVLTRQQILDAVWGAEPDVYSNVVDLYVHYLRRKLGELERADRLRTVRGVGYMLRAEPDSIG